jgi:hypothetical protein
VPRSVTSPPSRHRRLPRGSRSVRFCLFVRPSSPCHFLLPSIMGQSSSAEGDGNGNSGRGACWTFGSFAKEQNTNTTQVGTKRNRKTKHTHTHTHIGRNGGHESRTGRRASSLQHAVGFLLACRSNSCGSDCKCSKSCPVPSNSFPRHSQLLFLATLSLCTGQIRPFDVQAVPLRVPLEAQSQYGGTSTIRRSGSHTGTMLTVRENTGQRWAWLYAPP